MQTFVMEVILNPTLYLQKRGMHHKSRYTMMASKQRIPGLQTWNSQNWVCLFYFKKLAPQIYICSDDH